jgi:IS30 family transposase
MKRLSTEERARILHLLCEGMSIRAITRLTGASKNTVSKLLVDAGKACMAYHDQFVRRVEASLTQKVDTLRQAIHKLGSPALECAGA